MVVFFILDGRKSGNRNVEANRNEVYVQIIKEILAYIANRNKELEIEVFWGNTSCVRSTSAGSDVIPAVEKAITSKLGTLHLGRLFDEIRSLMKPSDAIVHLTDAAVFKADITSYPLGMIFAIVVDIMTPNSDQISELKELVTTTNSDQARAFPSNLRTPRDGRHDWFEADEIQELNPLLFPCTNTGKQWVLRYSEFNDVKSLVNELMKSLLEPDFPLLYVGNLSASVCVIGFVRLVNMMNIPVDDVQFITPSQGHAIGRSTEKCPPIDEMPEFVRTKKQDGEDLLSTMGPALLETECVAIVLINETKYGCITAEKMDDDFCLILNKFPSKMPDFVPDFATLISGPDELADALHYTTLKGVAPSYGPVVQSWVTEHGFNIDFQKMMRLLRKLPDRPHLFYQEVNRFRNYALAIGMDHVLHEAARIIREEIAQLNAMAQKHGAYVATAFGM